ncbi:MAG: laccase domain-containing protein [Desulfovermiculus sp.]|nr:laccase domain-containing protein [Desulfovermiculus sp.]
MTRNSDQQTHIPFVFPGLERIQCCFTTRLGAHRTESGVHIKKIQEMLAAPSWLDMEQTHGTDMAFICEPNSQYADSRPKADALATVLSNQALVVSVADCQPLLLAHTSGRFIAALHVGWRANRADAPGLWVKRMCSEYKIWPQEIMAVRGPSLGPAWSEFVNFQQEWGREFEGYFQPQTQAVDLWDLTRDQLQQAGLRPDCIFSLDLCTYSLPQLFYSYRRDKTIGRQAGIIWISD